MDGYSDSWLANLRDFESNRSGDVPGLGVISRYLDAIADPQHSYKVIHVGGTNGKGSVVHYASLLAHTMGMSVGSYTSPDLGDITQRVSINLQPVDISELESELSTLRELGDSFLFPPPTKFEALTVAALSLFSLAGVELAVIEVGMGGEWDATNVVDAEVAVISSVDLDHMEYLGSTIGEIAHVKAGIIKAKSKVLIGEVNAEAVAEIASRDSDGLVMLGRDILVDEVNMGVGGWGFNLRTPFGYYEELFLGSHGRHQVDNAALAIASIEHISGATLPRAVLDLVLIDASPPGRLEVVSQLPLVLLDVAHNPAAARALSSTLREEFSSRKGWVVLLALATGRDPEEFLRSLGPSYIDELYAVDIPGTQVESVDVAHAASMLGIKSRLSSSLETALSQSMPGLRGDQLLVIVGGHGIVAEYKKNIDSK